MALMFQRLARNFVKNGYYPTDSETTQRILNALAPARAGGMRIIDPCCGEGIALAECKHHLGLAPEAFGVEYDAKSVLDRCIHGDFQDCIVGQRQFGLLWLNPPYGDLVTDKADTGDRGGSRTRPDLEGHHQHKTKTPLIAKAVLEFTINYTRGRRSPMMGVARGVTTKEIVKEIVHD